MWIADLALFVITATKTDGLNHAFLIRADHMEQTPSREKWRGGSGLYFFVSF
jgi:hypothetical protein